VRKLRNLRCTLRLIFLGLRNLLCAFTKQFAFSQFALQKNNRANGQITQTILDYLPKCCNYAFVKVNVLKENIKKNRN